MLQGAPVLIGRDEIEREFAETLRQAAWILEGATLRGESTPVWIGRDEIEREFSKILREAAWVFEKENNGRFLGCINACRAVAQFIYRRNGAAELAGPFLQIAEAFKDLEGGGKPRLFSKKVVPAKERDRSADRKHIQMLAAVALEVLVDLGEELGPAADRVARHVNRWPGMEAQDVKGNTVIAWRKQQHRLEKPEFDKIFRAVMNEPHPLAEIERLLEKPSGLFR
jgi:hypothetical protein